MTIAIFDSGAGGLTVLKTFLNLSCAANYIYFIVAGKAFVEGMKKQNINIGRIKVEI